MGHIFLSYAREDREFAECMARVLEGAGHSLWWDRHIDSGEEFSAEIEAELEKADAVVVAWSKQSVKSRWVRDEAAVGGDTGRLVPISVDGSLPPMGFRQFHTLDLTDWRGAKRDRRTGDLIHSVERRLKG
jgi:adenylate cyclase